MLCPPTSRHRSKPSCAAQSAHATIWPLCAQPAQHLPYKHRWPATPSRNGWRRQPAPSARLPESNLYYRRNGRGRSVLQKTTCCVLRKTFWTTPPPTLRARNRHPDRCKGKQPLYFARDRYRPRLYRRSTGPGGGDVLHRCRAQRQCPSGLGTVFCTQDRCSPWRYPAGIQHTRRLRRALPAHL